ncbi:nucleoredoxin 1 [Pelomyxa schiedti]|nr:nucleoredoxin 1 [Pelomyxa schiedti]
MAATSSNDTTCIPLAMLGGTFVAGSGRPTPAAGTLEDKAFVFLYFSAHWCPPCRGFTPKLATFYNKFAASKNFEIVFISSDRSEHDFQEYINSMPWIAIPYAEEETRALLSDALQVEGIPTLVLLDQAGNVLSTDARMSVEDDPSASQFPWVKVPFAESIYGSSTTHTGGCNFINKSLAHVPGSSLLGKYHAFYFSGSWCGPCHHFTPKLVHTYNQLKSAGKEFEIVFVSSDRSEADFMTYWGEMPWLALPYTDMKTNRAISSEFGVRGIPTLVLMDPTGKLVSTETRDDVEDDPEGARFPWVPQLVKSIGKIRGAEATAIGLLFAERATPERIAVLRHDLNVIAEEEKARNGTLRFYLADAESTVGLQIRSLISLAEGDVFEEKLLILDLPQDSWYLCEKKGAALTLDAMREFMAAKLAGTLPVLAVDQGF